MTTRQDAARRTRSDLLDAGLRLAERVGLPQMSVNLIVAEAGVAKGSFFHHFGDRASYLRALYQTFHNRLLPTESRAAETPPGRDRLWHSTLTYLDACRGQPGVRALLLEARAEPAVSAEIRTRNDTLARLAEADFAAMSFPQPLDSARLWIGMVAEAALLEFDSGTTRPDTRAALAHYLRQG